LRPVKQAGDGADGDGDACCIDGTDFFFEGGRADECAADDDADVHSGKHQRGIVGHGLMGADIGEDVVYRKKNAKVMYGPYEKNYKIFYELQMEDGTVTCAVAQSVRKNKV